MLGNRSIRSSGIKQYGPSKPEEAIDVDVAKANAKDMINELLRDRGISQEVLGEAIKETGNVFDGLQQAENANRSSEMASKMLEAQKLLEAGGRVPVQAAPPPPPPPPPPIVEQRPNPNGMFMETGPRPGRAPTQPIGVKRSSTLLDKLTDRFKVGR